jgi:hypothetical protein
MKCTSPADPEATWPMTWHRDIMHILPRGRPIC